MDVKKAIAILLLAESIENDSKAQKWDASSLYDPLKFGVDDPDVLASTNKLNSDIASAGATANLSAQASQVTAVSSLAKAAIKYLS